jgi:hypothetical protein
VDAGWILRWRRDDENEKIASARGAALVG